MATTQKKAPVKKAPARKAAARKAPAKKPAAKKSNDFSMKKSVEKAVNISLGVIGKSIDNVQDNFESARRENQKRMKDLEKRGAKLRRELNKRFDNSQASEVVEDAKEQFNKIQDQVEDVVDSARDKLKAA